MRWRCRLLALPYGDQGLLISRRLYDEVGGFAAIPLMEDVDLVRRLGRRRLAPIPVPLYSSARRYRDGGIHPAAAAQPVLPVPVFRRRIAAPYRADLRLKAA